MKRLLNTIVKWAKSRWAAILAAIFVSAALSIIALAFVRPLWFKDYGGAVQAAFVAALVAITAVYAWQTKKQADASVRMVEEMREQRWTESLPLLVPEMPPSTFRHGVDPNQNLYLDLQSVVGVKVSWRNLGKGVALNSRFSFWGIPLDNPPGKVLFFPPQESTALGVGEQKEIEVFETWGGQTKERPKEYRPRLVAKYNDIYLRKITTVQEFRIDQKEKKAYPGNLYFKVNCHRLGEEVPHHDS